jgi:hypothetical protein
LTSRSSRIALRCESEALALGLGPAGQLVLQGREQKRQGRAELVRDVREEVGLRAVELGQRLGTLAFMLQRQRTRERRRDGGREHVVEAP